MDESVPKVRRVFVYLFPAVHLCYMVVACFRNLNGFIPQIGMIDFPLTLIASPILMNVDMSVVWIVLYYALCGSLFWYLIGRGADKLL
jgi:hypothetical protein